MADLSRIRKLLERVGMNAPSGFGIAFHFRLTSPDFLFQTYQKDWVDLYSKNGYIMHDPVVRWGFINTGACRWSEITLPDDMKILEKSEPYGIRYGIALTVEGGGTRSGGGLARADREFTDAEIEELTALVQELHDLTASKDGMKPDVQMALNRMSIEMTHPGPAKS